MTHRKRIERLEENMRALACAGYQELHNGVIRNYLEKEFVRCQKKYVALTGKAYVFDPCGCRVEGDSA